MAKRQRKAQTRKAKPKTARKMRRTASKTVRKATRTSVRARAARPAARASKAAPRRKKAAPRKKAPVRVAKAKAKAPARRKAMARPTPAALSRERRRLTDEETVPSPPSTLDYSPRASSAESGHQMYHQRQREHGEAGSPLTGGELDSDWNDAYSSGEEAPGGDMPTPDQDVVEEIGRALGVEYDDAEELKGAEKIESRDRHRWEYDPASAEDYRDRNRRDED